jgi:hypothetical protein
MVERRFTGPSPEAAAAHVLAAIRDCDWPALAALLAANPEAAGQVEPWQRPEGPPGIADRAEVQQIHELMLRYPGKLLVRYDIPDEPSVYKLEIVVERAAGGFRVIDFWGLGW